MLAKMVFSPECSPPFPGMNTLQVMCSSIAQYRERGGAESTRQVPFKVYGGQTALKADESLLCPMSFLLFMSFPVNLGIGWIVTIWKCTLIHFGCCRRMWRVQFHGHDALRITSRLTRIGPISDAVLYWRSEFPASKEKRDDWEAISDAVMLLKSVLRFSSDVSLSSNCFNCLSRFSACSLNTALHFGFDRSAPSNWATAFFGWILAFFLLVGLSLKVALLLLCYRRFLEFVFTETTVGEKGFGGVCSGWTPNVDGVDQRKWKSPWMVEGVAIGSNCQDETLQSPKGPVDRASRLTDWYPALISFWKSNMLLPQNGSCASLLSRAEYWVGFSTIVILSVGI